MEERNSGEVNYISIKGDLRGYHCSVFTSEWVYDSYRSDTVGEIVFSLDAVYDFLKNLEPSQRLRNLRFEGIGLQEQEEILQEYCYLKYLDRGEICEN